MAVRFRTCLPLVLGLSSLWPMACASSRQAAAPLPPAPPVPTEVMESEGEIQRERELWEERQHRTQSGVSWREIETENRRRNLEMRAALVRQEAVAIAPVHWRERGSFDQSGRTKVTEVGSDGETLFIGTDNGGVFSGTPGGEHWVPRSDGLGIGVQSFVIVPGQPEVWFAMTWYGLLYMSADQGVTWSEAGIPREDQVLRVLRDRGRPRTVYALADGGHEVDGTWEELYRLYRSDDGGLHFSLVSSGPVAGPPDLWIDRVHGGTLYLATSGGLSKSTDAGVTFSPVGAPAGDPVLGVILTGSEAGAPTFYAAVNRQGHLQWELVVSEDGGRTWQERGELRDFWHTLTASITNARLVFVGGVNAYRSADAGRTFKEINQWYDYYPDPENKLHADLPGIDCAIYHGKETVFFNTDGGTYRSDDGGKTVRNITRYGLGNSQYYGILTSRNDTELIAAGAQDQGYQLSHPGSGSVLRFDQIVSGDYGSLTSSDGTHDMLYSAYPGFLLLQTHEGEKTLESFDFPVPREQRRNGWIPALAADPDNPNVVYYADRRIWRIQRIRPGTITSSELPQDFAEDEYDYVSTFAISPLDRNRWLAANTYGWIWRSHDGGQTWTRARSGLLGHVSDLLPSPTDPDLWYAAGSGYAGPAVVRTTDGGETWEPWSSGLPQTLAKALAFDDPVRQGLYVATEAGPFRFDTQTAAWISLLGTEAPLTDYRDVEGIPEEGVVRFATYGRGIWDYSPTGGRCVADDQTFCFLNGRFEVKVAWKDFANNTGVGHAVPGSGTESGLFWFFQPANWELMVKVLDGCGYNNRFWVFSAATTTVEYTLQVRDTQTGQMKEYKNPSGRAAPAVTDTGAFSCSASAAASAPAGAQGTLPSAMAAQAPRFLPAAASAGCADTATTLCLADRFRLEMTWRDSQNRTGSGQLASLRSSDSGVFWFFSPTNWETLAKIVNGCALNGHYWVFGAALTNVEYTLRVTDTVTGEHREYFNPLGVSSPTIADTSALHCN